jgi:hypothetical protein
VDHGAALGLCVHELAVLLAGQTAAQTDRLAPWMNACISSSVTRLRSEHEPVSTGLAQELGADGTDQFFSSDHNYTDK